jgi:hypothetical protein
MSAPPSTRSFKVGLMRRYSNPVYQGSLLHRMVEMAEKSIKSQVREASPLPQAHMLTRRLSLEAITELVQSYRDGMGTPELRRRYNLSQGSVLKLLRAHGVTMRRQGLADTDLLAAAELYRDGAPLAEIGERFGVSYSAVRRALIASGVRMRSQGGSKPRS